MKIDGATTAFADWLRQLPAHLVKPFALQNTWTVHWPDIGHFVNVINRLSWSRWRS